MGGGNNAGHARGARPLLRSCSTRTPGSRETGSSGSSPSPTRIPTPPSSGRGCGTSTARCSARCAAIRRSGGSRPSTSSSASSRRARELFNAFYGGGFDHDATREVESLQGAALLVRREAADAVGLFDESFFMFSEETDWLLRFRQAGWKVVFYPGRRGRPRRRRLARRPAVRREPARHPALPRQAPRRRARPSARGGCCSWSLRLRALALPRRAAAAGTARARASSPRATSGRCSDDRRVPAARARDGARAAARAARRARARAAGHLGDARLGASRRSSLAWAVVFAVHGTIWLAVGVLARSASARSGGRAAAAGRRARSRRDRPGPVSGHGAVFARRDRARAAALARRGRRHRRRALPPRARPQARRARRPPPAHRRRVPGRRAPSRATRSRSGTASWRSSRSSPGLDPSVVVEPRGVAARAARLPRRLGGRRRPCSARPAAGSRCSRPRSRSSASPPATAARTSRSALPGDGVAAAARAGRVRALLHLCGVGAARPTRPRSPPSSARSRSSTRPTRSSC